MKKSSGGPSVAAVAMEVLFQKNLVDLVRGLRSQMIGEQAYLAQALADVRKELKSTDTLCKAVALQKLTYVNMLQGADMGWAAFACVEVMSAPCFAHKEMGYLAACQSFQDHTQVLLLITHLLRKDLGSANQHEAALALNCLACVATPDLARDLTPDVFTMLNSTRPYVRKRAIPALLRMGLRDPEVLKTAFRRLVERLEDTDEGVVRTAVSILCELAVREPRAYLPLAPQFFRLLTSSSNNWMLLKLVKIFKVLVPLEPRLGRKLCDPLLALVRSTAAKALLFECIRAITEVLPEQTTAVRFCILKLRELVEDHDPNVKYLGLRTLASLMAAHRDAVGEHKAAIVGCLDDADPGVQACALQLLVGMVTRENLVPTVTVLCRHMLVDSTPFCDELVGAVLAMGGHESYARVLSPAWYLEVLTDLAGVPGSSHGEEVGRQLIDVAVRMDGAHGDAVEKVRRLLLDAPVLTAVPSKHPTVEPALAAAAWITGEYAAHVRNARAALEALLQPKVKVLLPPVQAGYVQAVLKVFLAAVAAANQSTPAGTAVNAGDEASADLLEGPGSASSSPEALAQLLREHLQPLAEGGHMEVQERVAVVLALLDLLPPGPELPLVAQALGSIFKEKLKPVGGGAQEQVRVPDGLELESSLEAIQLGGMAEGVPGGRKSEVLEAREDEPNWPSGSVQTSAGWGDGNLLVRPSEADVAESKQTARVMLAQHRARHDPYYLHAATRQDGDPDLAAEGTAAESSEGQKPASLSGQLMADADWGAPKKSRRKPAVSRRDEDDLVPVSPDQNGPWFGSEHSAGLGSDPRVGEPLRHIGEGGVLADVPADGAQRGRVEGDAGQAGPALGRETRRQSLGGYEGEGESGLDGARADRRKPREEGRNRRKKEGHGSGKTREKPPERHREAQLT